MALVTLNRRGLAELATSAGWRAHLTKTAAAIRKGTAGRARASSYADSLDVEIRDDGGELVARVGTDDPFAHLDEWGSSNNAPSGAMRRTVDALGLSGRFR